MYLKVEISRNEVRAKNGVNNAKKRVETARKRRVYELKRNIGQSLKKGYASESAKSKLREYAIKYPQLLGEYANV